MKAKLQTQRDNAVLSPDKSSNHESLSDCVYSDSELNYDDMITYKNLRTAYFQTIKGKQHRYRVQKFKQNFVSELKQLYKELKTRAYRPGAPKEFKIWCTAGQKNRIIRAPTLRDLIVQRLLYNYVYDAFDKGFIFDSYGCRKQKGAHKSADRTQHFIKQSDNDSYYLQIDIHHYYYSIQKTVLKKSLERKIKDCRIVDLLLRFMPAVGVDVGSILAQLFGLLYLDRFDHYVKRQLKIKHYIRYVDDMVFIGLKKDECHRLLTRIQNYMQNDLKLTLSKWKIQKLSNGINFCGYRTNPLYRLIRKRSIKTFNRALQHRDYKALESILAHAERTASYRFLIQKLKGLDGLPEHLKRRIVKWHTTHLHPPKGHTATV